MLGIVDRDIKLIVKNRQPRLLPRRLPPVGLFFNAGSTADGHNWPAMSIEHACMAIARVDRQVTALAARAVLLLTLSLGGCASSTVGSSLMDARAEVAAPPKASSYPAVEDLPPSRDAMTLDQQSKLKKELTAARDRQAGVKSQGDTAQTKPKKPKPAQPPNPAQPTNEAVRQ
jgi:hypothetical protein